MCRYVDMWCRYLGLDTSIHLERERLARAGQLAVSLRTPESVTRPQPPRSRWVRVRARQARLQSRTLANRR